MEERDERASWKRPKFVLGMRATYLIFSPRVGRECEEPETRKLESISRVIPLAFILLLSLPLAYFSKAMPRNFSLRSKNHLRAAIFLSQDAISPLRVTGVRIGIKSTSLIQASKGRERKKSTMRCSHPIPESHRTR